MATASNSTQANDSGKPKLFPMRRRSGTADFHLSKKAVGFGLDEIEALSAKQVVMFFAEARWGSTTTMPCAHCHTVDSHYWSASQYRWKCKSCGKRFSVTSNTVLADRKLPLKKIFKMALAWSNAASGHAALELRRDWNISYLTAHNFEQKMREGLVRGFNQGALAGAQEFDGMDLNGRRSAEKRNKPVRSKVKPKLPANLLKPDDDAAPPADAVPDENGELHGPPKPPKYDKNTNQNPERRQMIVQAQRGVTAGKGASATRVAVSIRESAETVTAMANRFASADSIIFSDEDGSYSSFRDRFLDHRTINHTEQFSDGKGTSNNLAESVNARVFRLVEVTHSAVSNKYLTDYVVEGAWRVDTRRLSTKERVQHLFRHSLSVGLSRWWRGYTHGHHREEEFLLEGDRKATGRGRKKGWKAKKPR